MSLDETKNEQLKELRRRAEARLGSLVDNIASLTPGEIRKIVHELHTHQIELELQNEELRQAQVDLTTANLRYTDLYDFAPVGYLTVNGKGMIIETNLTASAMLGRERRFLINTPFSSCFIKDEQDSHFLCRRQLLETKEPQTCERRMRRSDDSEFDVFCKCEVNQQLGDVSGQSRTMIMDISARKAAEHEKSRLESQIRQALKMQAVGSLAGGIAHEFNNMLGVIMGCADMARGEVPQDSFAKVQLERILTASYRVKDLVKQLLTFSRQAQQQRIPANLCLLVKESVKLIGASIPSSVDILIKTEDTACGNAIVDPTEIQQIIMNLCSNAVWAMKENGTITISINEVDWANHDESVPKGLSAGSYVKLSVSDIGCGMDKRTLSQVFDPFFTTKEVGQGTGLGLSIVYSIIESYGGQITVESEVGTGTTFRLYFPVTEAPMTEEHVEKGEDQGGTERILFVDDEEIYAIMCEEMLSRLGYEVDMRMDSREALETFKSAPDDYHLIITDQIMPDLSGEELVKEIRSIRPGIPIILCTGYSSQMDEKKAKSLGINEFVFKPISKFDIAKIIRKVLDEK